MLSPLLFAAAVLAGIPDVPARPAATGPQSRRPAPEQGKGGPFEPVEPATVVVEARPVEAPRPFMPGPDPELERRYAPRERATLNRIRIPF